MKKSKIFTLALAGAALLGAVTWAAQAVTTKTVTGEVEGAVRYGKLALRVLETDKDGRELSEDDVKNLDLTASASVEVTESGKKVQRNVLVSNECDHAIYVRVKPVLAVTNSDGTAAENAGLVTIDWDTTQWAGPDADGWYIYNGVLARKGDKTPALITALTFDTDNLKDKQASLTVDAQALQAENNPLPDGGYASLTGWPAD